MICDEGGNIQKGMGRQLIGNQRLPSKRLEINHLCIERIRKSLSVNEGKIIVEREKP